MNSRPSIDGFVTRGQSREIGQSNSIHPQSARPLSSDAWQRPAIGAAPSPESRELPPQVVSNPGRHTRLRRSDIDQSLTQIDSEHIDEVKRVHARKASRFSKKKLIKRLAILLFVIGLSVAGWVGGKALLASFSVFNGDIFGLVQQKPLAADANGRSNILVLGTSEDDPGHDASYLTDSMMIISVSQTKKDAYMISIPRDLYVKYGRACEAGYAGKINAYFNCVNPDESDSAEQERQAATREFIGGIFGLDLQYSARVNYSVMRDTVAALDGITVNIEGSAGAPGVMDSNFDWKCKGGDENASLATMKKNCPPNGHFIEYPNGPAKLDAEHALYLAQARGDSVPTYGLSRSNFDRELNQQKIVVAIKDKATSTGTLTNVGKVTGLIDAVGNNLRTNFETSEIRTLISLAQDVPSNSIHSINMVDSVPAVFTTEKLADVGDSVIPAEGLYEYDGLRAFVRKQINANPVTREGAKVVVLNGSGVPGAAQVAADKLEAMGFTIVDYGNAPAGTYARREVYAKSTEGNPATRAKFEQLYGSVKEGIDDFQVSSEVDFIVVLGPEGESEEGQSLSN